MSILWLIALSYLSATYALDYYVSPTGSDSSSGSVTRPFLTLNKAQTTVRAAVVNTQAENITVHIADGVYILSDPLLFTAEDSGKNGYTVSWSASGSSALISGGTELTGWTLNSTTGIYNTTIPVGTISRHLYVGGSAAQYARTELARSSFTFDNTTIKWTSSANDWLASLPGIENAEIRAINSFTDRYSPIKSASAGQLLMDQPAWVNNIWGYDTISDPFADEGFYIQNAMSLLTEENEYFLDSSAGQIYYKPLQGEDMAIISTYLGSLETLIAIGGTYDVPAHDITFKGLNFAHTTWNNPTTYGYVDQQTGGYVGNFNLSYPVFEATRPHWYQMPSAIQISAAYNIAFVGGNYTQLGAGGFGIGNDANAHITGVGLGAQSISIKDGYFTQVMGNSLTIGGIQADAHHPSDLRMINSNITVSGNIFYNTSSLFSSTVPIFSTYIQNSEISNNDLSWIPYSGICYGYGWGANDAGGSPRYIARGLYNYQPLYTTPTTSQNNIVKNNLIHDFGITHTDLGGIYTLSKSPGTVIHNNFDYTSKFFGIYTDEGSNSLTIQDNVFFPDKLHWYNPNQASDETTGNNTFIDNLAAAGDDYIDAPNGTGAYGDTYIRNYVIGNDVTAATVSGQRIAYRAGVLPGRRAGRPVSNSILANSHIAVTFPVDITTDVITVNISNFEGVVFTDVSFSAIISSNFTLTPVLVPTSIPSNSFALATWKVAGSSCTAPIFSVNATYVNPLLGTPNTLSIWGTLPGTMTGVMGWAASSSWPAQFGNTLISNTCATLGITTSGRDILSPDDDWAALYYPAYISTNGYISVYVDSQDDISPWTKSGVVVRNTLASNTRSTGYAALVVTPSEGVSMMWDSDGDGTLDQYTIVTGVKAPVFLKIAVFGLVAIGAYSTDEVNWTQVGGNVTLVGRGSTLDIGMIHTSHSSFNNATAIFSRFRLENDV